MTTHVDPLPIRDLILRDEPVAGAADSVVSGIEAVRRSACGCVAVVNDDHRLCGTFGAVSCAEAVLPGYLPTLEGAGMIPQSLDSTLLGRNVVEGGRVSDYADRRAISIRADSSLLHLASLFVTHRVPIVPVVESGELAGVIPQERFLDRLLVHVDVQ